MKVAVSARGPLQSDAVDQRFGRAAWFIVVDTERGTFEALRNEQNLNAAQGAGIQSAQAVVGRGVEAVLTGHCGPKAFRVLRAAGVHVYLGAGGTVLESLERLKAGSLVEATEADSEGHWV